MKWPCLVTVCVLFDTVMAVFMHLFPSAATPIRMTAVTVTACFAGLALFTGGPRHRY